MLAWPGVLDGSALDAEVAAATIDFLEDGAGADPPRCGVRAWGDDRDIMSCEQRFAAPWLRMISGCDASATAEGGGVGRHGVNAEGEAVREVLRSMLVSAGSGWTYGQGEALRLGRT